MPGLEFARTHRWPVVLKPNTFSQGVLVTVVWTPADFERAAREIFRVTDAMLVEAFCQGEDIRVVVFDGDVIAAYRRHPLSVVGDGIRSISELIAGHGDGPTSTSAGGLPKEVDFRIPMKLAHMGLSLDSVPGSGVRVQLLDCANLTLGGRGDDITPHLHPTFRRIAVQVAAELGLTLVGVDIISPDVCRESDYVIIEVNSAPGLEKYASFGEAQSRVADDFYGRLLRWLEAR